MSDPFARWRDQADLLDRQDDLAAFRAEFYLPPGQIYLDGNSLGPLSRRAEAAVLRTLDEWRTLAIEGWTAADTPWFILAETLAERTACLVGASADEVIVANSTTVNLHQLVATLYEPDAERPAILIDGLCFPSDRYALASHLSLRGLDPDTHLHVVPSRDGVTLDEADLCAAMSDCVQLAVFPAVVYTSAQVLDMARLARHAHARGVRIGFDCSHSIGAIPHELDTWDVDFAFWCHYKYLNGGPGATGGLYLNRRHFGRQPGLAGWFSSQKDRQFEMSDVLAPAQGAGALQIGTPNILSMVPLAGALELNAEAGMDRLRRKSLGQTGLLRTLIMGALAGTELEVVTPVEDERRGGHIAIRHPEAARICKALRAVGVVPDYRPPDLIRLCPAPLYTRYVDCVDAVARLADILAAGTYHYQSDERELVP
jgi:kynureninase